MFDIKGHADSLNLYNRVVEGRMNPQALFGNVLLSGAAGVAAAEFTHNHIAHNQIVPTMVGMLTMLSCVRKLEIIDMRHPEPQSDSAPAIEVPKTKPEYNQAA